MRELVKSRISVEEYVRFDDRKENCHIQLNFRREKQQFDCSLVSRFKYNELRLIRLMLIESLQWRRQSSYSILKGLNVVEIFLSSSRDGEIN